MNFGGTSILFTQFAVSHALNERRNERPQKMKMEWPAGTLGWATTDRFLP
jgi:hypothetical protein|eukprot:COSAG06_NODE_55864_length_287_cov_1.106383_1_plen_50_part_00